MSFCTLFVFVVKLPISPIVRSRCSCRSCKNRFSYNECSSPTALDSRLTDIALASGRLPLLSSFISYSPSSKLLNALHRFELTSRMLLFSVRSNLFSLSSFSKLFLLFLMLFSRVWIR